MVGAEDLHDRLAAGQRTRDPDRVHRRLRARVDKAPARQREALGKRLGDDHRVFGDRREMRSQLGAIAQRLHDRGMCVPLHHRAETVVEVPVAVAVHVGDRGAVARGQIDRPGVAQLVGGGDAAAKRALGAFEHRRRARRALVQARDLFERELLDALAVDMDGAADGHRCLLGWEAPRRDCRAPAGQVSARASPAQSVSMCLMR